MTQESRGRRRGAVFSVRVTEEERAILDAAQAQGGGPRALGPWLVWSAIRGANVKKNSEVVPARARPVVPARGETALENRHILDLCGGSGSWSRPYREAGYPVHVVDLDHFMAPQDVRLYAPPASVWGVLCAPPCTEFSMARNGSAKPRDFVEGMSVVNACMRVVLQCSPAWWALENPTGHLSKFLGTPRDTWEPADFGDPWTKRTSVWGKYQIPTRGPYVTPTGSAMQRTGAAARAVTPPGFARAFFEANP